MPPCLLFGITGMLNHLAMAVDIISRQEDAPEAMSAVVGAAEPWQGREGTWLDRIRSGC